MTRILIAGLMIFLSANVFAEDVYYLNNLKSCELKVLNNGKLEVVDSSQFSDTVLQIRRLPKNPAMVAFKQFDRIYVTKESCVVSVDARRVKNRLNGHEFKKEARQYTEQEKFNSYKYYLELETGIVKMMDDAPVGEDYNSIFPTSSSGNPVSWGSAKESTYKAGMLLSLGFGYKLKQERFLAFKVRLLSGQKSDTLSLTDVNTGISQNGSWTYEDSFKNFYAGYKFLFDYGTWKPMVAAYLGVSMMTSTMTDEISTYELKSSLSPAALLEAGLEYHLNSHWAIAGILGFEYMGKKSMTFSDSSGSDFKTGMGYNNNYLSFGVKYYFK